MRVINLFPSRALYKPNRTNDLEYSEFQPFMYIDNVSLTTTP